MLSTLAVKDTAKQAWDTIKTQRMGVDRVREANAQRLQMEFESIRFKDGETVDDFSMRITSLVNNMQVPGDTVEEKRVVKKFLRVVPPRYTQVAIAIETLLDLSTLSSDELAGRLRSAEECYGIGEPDINPGAQLLLTEEEWRARERERENTGWSSSSGNPKGYIRGNGRDKGFGKGKCYYCGISGHFARECRKPRREWKQEAHLSMFEDDQPALLMASTTNICSPAHTQTSGDSHYVYLSEEHVHPVYTGKDVWYFDTGASNHMSGCREIFMMLDEGVKGSVKLGDGSVVEIWGCGSEMFLCKTKEHKVLTEVYFMPRLRSNIISIGQLDENECKTVIENCTLCLFDLKRVLLAQVPRAKNRLYTVTLELVSPVCLLSKLNDIAWLWRARYSHLNFRSLRCLAQESLVEGIPLIDHIDQFCDSCALGKQHRSSFPQASTYRASSGQELVHVDLCGPIAPVTPGGNHYFLLIVDDYSRYMWLEMLKTKDEAFKHFKKFKTRAEVESQGRLMAFRSDRGGEFNSNEFREFCDEHGIKHCTTAPYSPQQNGVVERRNQTILEMARCVLKGMGMPTMFWGEAVKTAVYILNRSPT
ncbi:unnamed protein product [Cuscuta europaea]|uniref:Uncharacterized protein n=1 Tax=Cuscuta europaea TaxID=41803 RepID=A0A9P1EN70_CUSEU|nr:unnamed protein product [Cuscuta europaea]